MQATSIKRVLLYYMKNLLFLLAMLGSFTTTLAQNIVGTWQGNMTNEFIQLNVEQKGNQLCGYSYDYQLADKSSRCIALFEGIYDPERKLWYIYGRRFIENSGSHVLMKMVFWNDPADGKNILKGRVFTSSLMGAMLDDGDPVELKRVSSKPQQLGNLTPPCFPTPPKSATKKNTAPTIQKTPSPVALIPSVPKKSTVPVAKPSTPKPTPAPQKETTVSSKTGVVDEPTKPMKPSAPLPVASITERQLIQKMNARKQQTQSKLQISVSRINLKVYDNGTIDNDTVSIFYNGRLLISKQRLSETAIELNIDLDEGKIFHEFTMFAENLGSIPPNTALIVITAGDKRYELRSKASLEENAVLIIEYKPK